MIINQFYVHVNNIIFHLQNLTYIITHPRTDTYVHTYKILFYIHNTYNYYVINTKGNKKHDNKDVA